MESNELLKLRRKTLVFRRLNKRNRITGESYYGDDFLKFYYSVDGITLSLSNYKPEILFNITLHKTEIHTSFWKDYNNQCEYNFSKQRFNYMIRNSLRNELLIYAMMFGFYDVNKGRRNQDIVFSIGKIKHIKF